MTTIGGEYKEPDWAIIPSSPSSPVVWTLIEIKGGIEVGKYDLSHRATNVLGRAVDLVHIPLHHGSISRHHARIAFDDHGRPWLRDLGSSHGTIVNKQRIPDEACGMTETSSSTKSYQNKKGSRGIRLFVGDIIKFGASTRYYILEGPESFESSESSEKEKLIEKLNNNRSKINNNGNSEVVTSKDDKGEGGVSWGISMDDDNDEHDGTATTTTSGGGGRGSNRSFSFEEQQQQQQQIPEKYRKELEKITAMKYKLMNLETEDSRIHRKAGEGLTDGQQKQLDRNAEREKVLRHSIQEREEQLQDKLNNRNNANARNKVSSSSIKRKNKNEYEYNDDDDDDYFDRTKNATTTATTTTGGAEEEQEAESEQTLTLKWKDLYKERQQLIIIGIPRAENRIEKLKIKLKSIVDDEDAFFVKNDLQLAIETKGKINTALTKNTTVLDEIEKLLKVVTNSKLFFDRASGYIGKNNPAAAPPPQPQQQQATLLPVIESSKANEKPEVKILNNKNEDHDNMNDASNMPPPPPPVMLSTGIIESNKVVPSSGDIQDQLLTTTTTTTTTTTSPTNKRKHVYGPMMPPPPPSFQTPASLHLNPPIKASAAAATACTKRTGTLSFLDHQTVSSSSSSLETNLVGNNDDRRDNSNNNNKVEMEESRNKKQRHTGGGGNNSRTKSSSSSSSYRQLASSSSSASMDSSSKMDVWRAPEGQDGSGKTKLNEKFAGRY